MNQLTVRLSNPELQLLNRALHRMRKQHRSFRMLTRAELIRECVVVAARFIIEGSMPEDFGPARNGDEAA